MELDHPELEPFEPTLKRLLDLAFANGKNALASAGFEIDDVKRHEGARRLFIRNVHYGYDQAQDRIGKLVIDLEGKISSAEREFSQVRRSREAGQFVLGRIKALRDRELVLRRIVDTILMTLVHFDTWILRRLSVDGQIRRVDPAVLGRTLRAAAERNAESRYRFGAICDLTTFVQIGDLVEVDLTPDHPKGWRVVELKAGKMNAVLSGLLEEAPRGEPAERLDGVLSSFGKGAAKQARRMLVQQKRMDDLKEIIQTDHGIDPFSKAEIDIDPEVVVTEQYDGTLRRLVETVMRQEVATTTVDSCLHLLAGRGEFVDRSGGLGAVRHVFYHLVNPERACALGTSGMHEEMEALESVPPFVDLVSHSMHAQWGSPAFLWMLGDDDRTLDLVMGRVRLFALFDFEAFFQQAAASGIKMSWLVGKEAEKIKRFSLRIPGSPNAWGVNAELPDGKRQMLLTGFLGRVIADLTRPRQLIELTKRSPAEPSGQETK